jgi:hypothetical protein
MGKSPQQEDNIGILMNKLRDNFTKCVMVIGLIKKNGPQLQKIGEKMR